MNPAQVLAFMKEAAYLPKRTYMSSDAFAWLRALGFEQHEPELTDLGVVTVEDMEGLTTELLEQTTITTKDINKLLNGVRGLEDQMAPDMEDWLTGLGLRAHIPAFEQAGLLTLEQMAGLGAEGSGGSRIATAKALAKALQDLGLSKMQSRKLKAAVGELETAKDQAVDASVQAWLGEIGLPALGEKGALQRIGVFTLHDVVHVRMPDLSEIEGMRKIDKRKLLREAKRLNDKLRRQREKAKKKRKEAEKDWREMGDGMGEAANKVRRSGGEETEKRRGGGGGYKERHQHTESS